MRGRIAFAVLTAMSCATWVFAQGCGGDDASQGDATDDVTTGNDTGSGADTGTGSDTGSGADTGTGSDTGTGNDTGTSDGGAGTYRCGFGPDASMVASCANCAGQTLDCVLCSTKDASVTESFCGSAKNGCFANNNGFAACPCTGDAGECLEGYQVCRPGNGNTFSCRTCGEPQTDTLACHGGGACEADAGCL